MKRLLCTFLILMGSAAHAVVDMRNANYAESFVDIQVPGTGYSLEVLRSYNSRSIFSGIFGYGWCSDFETKIDVTLEGNLRLTECGGGMEISYYPSSFNTASINKVVENIISRVKAKNKTASQAYLDTLAQQIRQDSELREIWAKEVGLKPRTQKTGTVYLANGSETDRIVFSGEGYDRQLPDGTRQKFDRSGQLTHLYDRNGNFLRFNYANGLISEVLDNSGRKLSLSYYPNRRVKSITAPGGLSAHYKYSGEDLVEVKNAWNNTYTYAYDGLHNLTQIGFPDKTKKTLTYDTSRDWVTSFTDRNGCKETYTYKLSEADPQNQYSSSASRVCDGKVVNNSKHEFWHRTRSDGKKFLHRVRTSHKGEVLDIVYHEVFGKPITVSRNSVVERFEYFANGLLKAKHTPTQSMTFAYENPFRKVSTVVTQLKNEKGKTTRTVRTLFSYDKKGNLEVVRNSTGQVVRVQWDNRGRMSKIIDQARREVHIQWNETVGKPAVITRPQVGSIRIQYNASGEMTNVRSDGGPVVAAQISTAFNELLEVISPATQQLNL